MKYLTTYKTTVLIFLFLFLTPYIHGSVKDWHLSPGKTFVFDLNIEQVEKLFRYQDEKDLLAKVMTLPRPVASFTNEWKERPDRGHFVYANIHKDEVTLHYTPAIPFQVFLVREYGRLSVQVIDTDGNIRKDAKVRIKNYHLVENDKPYKDYNDTPLPYDKTSLTYSVEEGSRQRQRYLTVELDGFTAFLELYKKIPYRNFSQSGGYGSQPFFYSYMVTDKNKYKPGETIRFKSYALSGNRQPLESPLNIWFYEGYNKGKTIGKIKPNHPGNYTGEIQLHDSLDITLDKNYSIQLRDNRGKIVASARFRYEDYELFDNKLEVILHDRNQYHPENNILEIQVKDANGLTLPDAHAEIRIIANGIKKVFDDYYILSDTIQKESLQLNNDGTTLFTIPAYLFGKANLDYKIEVTATTLDNQPLSQTIPATFYYSHNEITANLEGNQVKFELLRRGKPEEWDAWIYFDDDESTNKRIRLPHTEPFEQFRKRYTVKIPELNLSRSTSPYVLFPDMDLTGGFSAGNFTVKADNPLGLEFNWYIYAGARLVKKGFGKELNETIPDAELDAVHFVELCIRLGDDKDEEEIVSRTFSPATKHLSITTDLPDRVYPGQEIKTTIQVKDFYGKPVKNVDLTAMAYNQLLNYQLSDLPYYGPGVIGRNEKASYDIEDRLTATATIPLSYDYWNIHARLDTMDYYRFAYPRDTIFMYTEEAPEGITQFAPYVMHEGKAIEIYAIECNNKPVWFSWTENVQGYSFPVEKLKADFPHTLTLRLHDRVLTVDSIFLEPGKKTIISLERDYLPERVKQIKMSNQNDYKYSERYYLTSQEQNKYSKFISEIPVREGINFTWLQQKDKIYPVHFHHRNEQSKSVLFGPYPPGRTSYCGGVEYNHTGGYEYDYEPNVVYKYPLDSGLPGELKFNKDDNFRHIHEFYITVDSIQRYLAGKEETDSWYWQPEEFRLTRPGLNLNMQLKRIQIKSPIAGVTFYNKSTEATTIHPKELSRNHVKYTALPADMYDIYLFYQNGEYIKVEDIPIQQGCYIHLNLTNKEIQQPTDKTRDWFLEAGAVIIRQNENRGVYPTSTIEKHYQPITRHGVTNSRTIEGILTDEDGDPLIGTAISVLGTTCGTISDIDGKFILNLEGLSIQDTYRILFSYIGYNSIEINAEPGSYLEIMMGADNHILDEVIVVGYGAGKKTSYIGAVSSISSSDYQMSEPPPTHSIYKNTKESEAEQHLYQELLILSGLRRNFSDVGFWEPVLYTDKQGEASFNVTIPDNITQWNTIVYAMDRKLQTGTLRHAIKSYKPLMGELKTPQFLVVGDSAWSAATIRNYTQDKQITGEYQYTVNGDTIQQIPVSFEASWQKRMPINPISTDSLTTTFLFTRQDGYKDGEERTIPVIPTGTMIAEGDLQLLKNGEQVYLETKTGEETHVRITGNALNIYEDVTYYLMGYEYACNEQLASKLTGLLSHKMYVEQYQGKRFRYDKQVNEIINRLLRNRNKEQLWSWWGNNDDSSLWMSAHILKALKMAADAGYKVNIQLKWARNDYMTTLPYRQKAGINDIELLHTLSHWGLPQDYEKAVLFFEEAIRELEEVEEKKKLIYKTSYLKDKLLLWEIRRQQGLPFDTEMLTPYVHTTTTGQYYCDDEKRYDWRSDRLAKTLIAYRLIRNDSILNHMKEGMQMYILSTRGNYWNTYQSANILSTLLPDLIAENSSSKSPVRLTLTGKENRELTEMEYQTILRDGEKLTIEKKEGVPVIYSSWQYKRKTEGYSTDAFSINTYFQGNTTYLEAGIPVKLYVNVEVKEENSEYVMIEIPIPAGCSYAAKNQYYYNEVHREYFKEKTVIFCRKLTKGNYNFSIDLLPRFTGTYHINPAKVELMYLPAINAMNDLKKIKIADLK